jgi:hypothetical protein
MLCDGSITYIPGGKAIAFTSVAENPPETIRVLYDGVDQYTFQETAHQL